MPDSEKPQTDHVFLTSTLHGTGIYADQLGWCQGVQWGGIYSSPMGRVWVGVYQTSGSPPLPRRSADRKNIDQFPRRAPGRPNHGGGGCHGGSNFTEPEDMGQEVEEVRRVTRGEGSGTKDE